ncbi:hypothetical protein GCM10017784_18740 [Deinococcus indicus]|uniref:hypothetical protein n=1 Tax=Deinococcus TaxID=1298 RepID=UPI001747F916|nr:hypothetical protein [Deinococcus indicus]GHG26477.1 hypothetical protein GCM10017784_18740 [Deinococcus indicus]
MTHPESSSLSDFPLPAFTDDLTRLMVQRGVTSLAARPDLPAGQTALLGLTEQDVFTTQDLAFAFMGEADHRAAAEAYRVDASAFQATAGQRGQEDAAQFARATGDLFDRYGVMALEFPAGSFLGFRNTAQGMRFTVDGVELTLRGSSRPA